MQFFYNFFTNLFLKKNLNPALFASSLQSSSPLLSFYYISTAIDCRSKSTSRMWLHACTTDWKIDDSQKGEAKTSWLPPSDWMQHGHVHTHTHAHTQLCSTRPYRSALLLSPWEIQLPECFDLSKWMRQAAATVTCNKEPLLEWVRIFIVLPKCLR